MPAATVGNCELCDRERPLTFHHLIPRKLHSNKWFKKNFTREQMNSGVDICRDCHSAIHAFIPHKDLGREYHSLEKLKSHEEVRKFVDWIASRDHGRIRSRRSK